LRPILSLFIDLISRKLLSMPDDLNRRIFVLLDEFGSLQRLSSIVNLLTEGRSKGACCFLGVQDDGQIEKIYSQQTRKTIDNACANRLTFALTGETAEKEAKYNIGEVEFTRFRRSYSMGPTDLRDGIGLSEEHKRDLMLLPSDIANFKDLSAIVRLRNYDFTISNWEWEEAKQAIDRFILRDDLLLENIVKDALNKKNSVKAGKPSPNISAT
jgi:type IV secretory pathway TraG/TraD family ATPase VirD4